MCVHEEVREVYVHAEERAVYVHAERTVYVHELVRGGYIVALQSGVHEIYISVLTASVPVLTHVRVPIARN